MNKMKYHKIICLLLFFFFLAIPSTAHASLDQGTVNSIKQTEKDIDSAQKEIQSLEDKKKHMETVKSDLDSQLNELMPRLIQLQELAQAKEEEIAATENELKEAQKIQEEQYEAMKCRIQFMYENGNIQYIEYILRSESIAEALNKAEYINELVTYDQNKLDEYKAVMKEISDKKASLDAEQADLLVVKGQADERQNEITKAIEETSQEIARYSDDLTSAQDIKAQYESSLIDLRTKLKKQALSLNTIGTNSAFQSSNIVKDPENYVSYGEFKITFYCPCIACNGNNEKKTSTKSTCTTARTIAVDPSVIPYGSKVMIGGHVFLAEDCGGDIKGNRIDVYVPTHEECNDLGVKMAEVFVRRKNADD